jgi:hypothetical protein
MADRVPTLSVTRKDAKKALRAAGLTDRQADVLLANWGKVVGEAVAENEELHEKLEQITRGLRP